MKKLLLLVALCALWPHLAAARAPLTLACEDGNQVITLSGLTAAQKVMGSFPSCTITVYLPGTVTLATIYADDVGTPKSNPFTALSTGWFTFYADNGCYDVRRSGAGLTPFTQPFCIFDSTGAGGGGYDTIQDEGTPLTQQTTLNFVGSTVTCANDGAGSRTTCTFSVGSGQFNQTIQDEGVPLTQQPFLNFTGAGVTCTNDGGNTRTNCTIPGGGSSDAWVDGGNSFASGTPTIGNINNKNMAFITNNIERLRLTSAGLLSLGANSTGVGITNVGSTGRIAWPKAYLEENTNAHRQTIAIGNGATASYTETISYVPIVASTVTVYIDNVSQGTDNGAGVLTGAGISAGTINYNTGAISVTFTGNVPSGDYVDVAFTVSGNLYAGTTNTGAFTVIPNTLKIASPYGMAAYFSNQQFTSLTTEHTTPITESPLGTIALQAKTDATDPLGTKKLYQLDSAGNEREFCYTDSGCTISNPFELNPAVKGGIVGAIWGLGGGTATRTVYAGGAGSSGVYPLPDNALIGPLWVCTTDTNAQGAIAELYWQNMSLPGGVLTAYLQNVVSTVLPGATAGCYGNGNGLVRFTRARTPTATLNVVYGSATYQGWAADVRGTAYQPVGSTFIGTQAGSSTGYSILWDGQSGVTEVQANTPIPAAGVMKNMCVVNQNSQSGTGSLVVSLRVDSTDEITITIPAGAGAGFFCDYSDTVLVASGALVKWKLVNNASVGSATVALTVGFYPTDPLASTALIPFPNSGGAGFTSSTDNFMIPYAKGGIKTTEIEAHAPIPRDGTADLVMCYVETPGDNSTTFTLMVNGVASSVTGTIAGATTGLVQTTGTAAITAGDAISLKFATGVGITPLIRSCVMNFI